MIEDDDGLKRLLRSAYLRVTADVPSRDVWPDVVERLDAPVVWSWFDLALLAALAGALLLFPERAWLLAFHF